MSRNCPSQKTASRRTIPRRSRSVIGAGEAALGLASTLVEQGGSSPPSAAWYDHPPSSDYRCSTPAHRLTVLCPWLFRLSTGLGRGSHRRQPAPEEAPRPMRIVPLSPHILLLSSTGVRPSPKRRRTSTTLPTVQDRSAGCRSRTYLLLAMWHKLISTAIESRSSDLKKWFGTYPSIVTPLRSTLP